MGQCPSELRYCNDLRAAGVTITLADYRGLASINRDDLVLMGEAAARKAEDDITLAGKK